MAILVCTHAASSYGSTNIPILELLLKMGGNINITDNEGDTPLHFCEDVEMAQFLISVGADPKQRNFAGQLPIETADEDERTQMVEYLIAFTPDFTPAERESDDVVIELDFDENNHDNEDTE
ncbi:hypothetical protein HK096_002778 [Nowakowskiella sp. JEL0078]|nr:hypothetical protein HK096_002778 [Nowakowskiella sp. JEL0078]